MYITHVGVHKEKCAQRHVCICVQGHVHSRTQSVFSNEKTCDFIENLNFKYLVQLWNDSLTPMATHHTRYQPVHRPVHKLGSYLVFVVFCFAFRRFFFFILFCCCCYFYFFELWCQFAVSLCVDSPISAMATHSELIAGLWTHSLSWRGLAGDWGLRSCRSLQGSHRLKGKCFAFPHYSRLMGESLKHKRKLLWRQYLLLPFSIFFQKSRGALMRPILWRSMGQSSLVGHIKAEVNLLQKLCDPPILSKGLLKRLSLNLKFINICES